MMRECTVIRTLRSQADTQCVAVNLKHSYMQAISCTCKLYKLSYWYQSNY